MLLPIDTERLGIVSTGQIEPVVPWIDAPDGSRRPGTEQERDEATGHPLWTVHAVIPTGERPTLVAVRVASPQCPDVQPFQPIAFERLEAVARVNRRTGQLAVYWSAAGLGDARRGGHKSSEQAAA